MLCGQIRPTKETIQKRPNSGQSCPVIMLSKMALCAKTTNSSFYLKFVTTFYFVSRFFTFNFDILNIMQSTIFAKIVISFVFTCFFYLRPKFGQLLLFRPKHFLAAKGFEKRPESRNLAVKTAKWQPWPVQQNLHSGG